MDVDPQNPPILDYSRTKARSTFLPNTRTLLQVAMLCAIVPAALGTLTIALWMATFSNRIGAFGSIVFLAGVLAFPIGCVSLLVFLILALARKDDPTLSLLIKGGFAAALLLLNIPLALVLIDMSKWHYVRVTNLSGAVISRAVIVQSEGPQVQLGSLAIGQTVSKWVRPSGYGPLHVITTANGKPTELEINISMGEYEHAVTLKRRSTSAPSTP